MSDQLKKTFEHVVSFFAIDTFFSYHIDPRWYHIFLEVNGLMY